MQLSGLIWSVVCRFLVEIEIILPAQMTVQESHDIALLLQHKVEALPDVERGEVVVHQFGACHAGWGSPAYQAACRKLQLKPSGLSPAAHVHVDYLKRGEPEHKVGAWSACDFSPCPCKRRCSYAGRRQ